MIARPRSETPTTTLPASLILTPREQKQYRRYQSQTSTLAPKSQGRLPTAVEYADFQSWLAKRDSGYLSDTPLADIAYYAERASQKSEENGKASVCGHALHPAHKEKAERCPVCIVEVHNTYMKALTVALEAAGGLVKQRWEAADQDCPALQAWYAGKLALLKELGRLEDLTLHERAYSSRSSSQATGEMKTATEALKMYWDSMEANPNMMQSPRQKKACTVVFCPETSFEGGRNQLYFWRKSPRYEAGGKYSSSNEDEDDNEEEEHEEQSTSAATSTRRVITLGHGMDDEEASDLEDSDSDEEEDEDDEDDEDDFEVEGSFVVFEYEEVAIPGAEFVVFGD
ncbi:hypothetical protein P171DRAFT_281641 [Karstenula rhodostoma CBS 690.94]|uniref:Uncharacterized protein n=1 Tax=Karstenula rhodostoma CBS 690.94 TaxID=1392251 RepID=A0A9P4UC09_9PLEO|nr:hypothetical protein P171DRAFT_281641 [Karstenula rhodostoma CBS 690.94]